MESRKKPIIFFGTEEFSAVALDKLIKELNKKTILWENRLL